MQLPEVAQIKRRRSPLKLLAIVIGSIVSLYLVLVIIGAIGWDGY